MNRDAIVVRDATVEDAVAICRIYNEGIEDRLATLETELRDPRERTHWLESRGPRHPVLVATRAGAIAGWGSLNPFNPRPAYDGVADFSVYIARQARGCGVGRKLLQALEERAIAIGFHKLVLAMFDWNEAGVRLYTRQGFRTVGTYREQGILDGRRVDVTLMEKIVGGEA